MCEIAGLVLKIHHSLWYKVQGTGNELLATTCDSRTRYDTVMNVYIGDCDRLECVSGNDDFCFTASGVSWQSMNETAYHVLVHGYINSAGGFGLTLEET